MNETLDSEHKVPDRLFVSKKYNVKYYKRLKESDSPLKSFENKDLFMLALSLGFKENNRESIDDKEGFIRVQYLSERDLALINTIAITEKQGLDILLHKKEIFTIAEEYANGGIARLMEIVFEGGYGLFSKKLEQLLQEELTQINQ